MNGTTLSFAAATALFALFPPFVLRGEGMRRYVTVDIATSIAALLLFLNSAHLALQNPAWWLSIFVVVKVAQFSIFLARLPDGRPAPSPALLGVFAALLFLALLPHIQQSPIDGDETHYTLLTDSLLRDHDLDLRNQYARSTSLVGRPIEAQFGDPTGSRGELYSRHEPFLSILLIPGYAAFGTVGATATMAILGGLLVFSLLSLVVEELPGFNSSFLLPFLIGPPVLFYATRIWPEVPAALCLSQALRYRDLRKPARFGVWLVLLCALKLRFALIAVPLLILALALSSVRDWKRIALASALLFLPVGALLLFDPGVFSVRPIDAVRAADLIDGWRGAAGLLFDAQSGLLFQAPLLFAGVILACSRRTSPALSTGTAAAALYLLFLIPRPEWHGGWSPPLRYIVVFMPLLAIAAGSLLQRLRLPSVAFFSVLTGGIAMHGLAEPPHLFHIANGESELGETLSVKVGGDVSRLLPSLVRPNAAAMVCVLVTALILVALIAARRMGRRFSLPASVLPAAMSMLLLGAYASAAIPGSIVQLEDAHVQHRGGRLYPEFFTVARFRFLGGWTLGPGEKVSFRARGGSARLYYFADSGAVITFDGIPLRLPVASHDQWKSVPVTIPSGREHIVRALEGEVTIDRIENE